MYLSLLLKLFLIFSLFATIGCSTLFGEKGVFRGKGKDYLRTDTLKPIDVPEDMNSRSLEPLYKIPDVKPRDEFGDYIALGEYEVPRPEAINTEKGKVGVKLQKLGERKWIFINASTSQVWPRTQNFLSEYGIRVAQSNPSIGLIETSDVVFKDDETQKSRFRIFIEKGVHPETTEIHILHTDFASEEQIAPDFVWPKTSKSVERERMLLDELANVLAKNVSNNAASLLGQNVGGALKVEFLRNMKEPTMRLRLFEERAKATVVHALDKEGFVLWEEAGEKGLYYVGFDPDFKEDSGFFSRLFGDSLPNKAPYTINELIQHLSPNNEVKQKFDGISGVNFGDALPDSTGLLVVVNPVEEDALDVVVRDMRGRKLPSAEAKTILRIIRKNLI